MVSNTLTIQIRKYSDPEPVKDMRKGWGDAGAVSKAAEEENVKSLLPACMAEGSRGMKMRGNAVWRRECGE
ncbi:hypothetical protein [Cupriavidus oxalaticus]|uniref:hypothetical protein n=1 Tax=Cupriavidus oxalaticus TaxID=96344 RepID=UPI001F0FC52D|nr:hypothetical protein [Cupriavidus oxalaticus]